MLTWLAEWLDDLNNYEDVEVLTSRTFEKTFKLPEKAGEEGPLAAVAHVMIKGKEYIISALPTDL